MSSVYIPITPTSSSTSLLPHRLTEQFPKTSSIEVMPDADVLFYLHSKGKKK